MASRALLTLIEHWTYDMIRAEEGIVHPTTRSVTPAEVRRRWR